MKAHRVITYKRITRAAYLLGIVFLLAGMLLSMVSQPAQASFPARPTRGVDPVVRTPEGPQPDQPTPSSPHNPDNPGVPGNRVPGRNSQSFNFGSMGAQNVPTPPVRLLNLAGATVRFSPQGNYCLSQPEAGWIYTTVSVSIPNFEVGDQAYLRVTWRVEHPADSPYHADQVEVNMQPVTDGYSQQVRAWWPGASLWNTGGDTATIEIHWDATLYAADGASVLDTATLDAFFNGRCDARELSISHECAAGGGINWMVHNDTGMEIAANFTISDGTTGSLTVPKGVTIFATTTDGGYTAALAYENGLGGTSTAEDKSAVAGECRPVSITPDCRTGGGVQWSITNESSRSVSLTWWVDEGGQTNLDLGPGASTTAETSQPGEHTLHVTWVDYWGQSHTQLSTFDDAVCQRDLTVTHACRQGGGVNWTVHNPTGNPITFTWSVSPGGESGSETVAGGQNAVVFTTHSGEQTLTFTYTDYWGTTQTRTDTYDDSACIRTLTIDHACRQGGGVNWILTNPTSSTVNLTWSVSPGGEAGSGSIPAGQSAIVFTTHSGSQTLTITYTDYWGVGQTLPPDTYDDAACRLSLSLAHACRDGGGITWTVTNPSAYDVDVTWRIDNGAPVTQSLPAGQSFKPYTESHGSHTLYIEYNDYWKVPQSASDTYSDENCQTLTLDYNCPPGTTTVDWYITNHNNARVSFTWWLDEGTPTGANIAANSRAYLYTVRNLNSHTMHIEWTDELGTHSASITNPDMNDVAECKAGPTDPKLRIVTRCGSDDSIEWAVTSDATVAIDFEWTMDGGKKSGSGTVPAGGRTRVTTSSNGSHTMIVSWDWEGKHYTTTRKTNPDLCVPPPPPPPPPTIGRPPSKTGTTTPGVPETGGTPIPTLQAPSTTNDSQAVAPVTGADLKDLTLLALAQRLFTNLGLLFLGIALILSGFASRLK